MIKTDTTIEIPLSKLKIILGFLGCVAFVSISIWLWLNADDIPRSSPLSIRIISVIGFSFFGFILVMLPGKLLDRRPGLIIDNEGITNNTSILKSTFIPWSYVTGFRTVQIERTTILLIDVNNARKLISRESKWTQKIMRSTQSMYGTPISISSVALKINFTDLEEILKQKHKELTE